MWWVPQKEGKKMNRLINKYLTEDILNEFGVVTLKDKTRHVHKGKVNVDGDGETDKEKLDHVHKIFQWLVQPADDHIHNLKE